MKPRKRSVSLVIADPRGLLLVRRPEDDESLPGLWGLPATSLEPGESAEDAVVRAGRAKLGVDVRPLVPIGKTSAERAGYVLEMSDWGARVERGEPEVPQPGPGTQYVELRWGEHAELVPAARAGSLCCRVLLEERGIDWES